MHVNVQCTIYVLYNYYVGFLALCCTVQCTGVLAIPVTTVTPVKAPWTISGTEVMSKIMFIVFIVYEFC